VRRKGIEAGRVRAQSLLCHLVAMWASSRSRAECAWSVTKLNFQNLFEVSLLLYSAMWATWMNVRDVMLRKHANHIKKTTAWLPLHEAPGESKSQRKCTIVATRDSGRGEGSHSLKKKAGPV
jgi:hypothetical protein